MEMGVFSMSKAELQKIMMFESLFGMECNPSGLMGYGDENLMETLMENLDTNISQMSIPILGMDELFLLIKLLTSAKIKRITHPSKQTMRIYCDQLLTKNEKQSIRKILEFCLRIIMGYESHSIYTRILKLLQDYKPHTTIYIARELQITYTEAYIALEECSENGLINKQRVTFGDSHIELFSIPLPLKGKNTNPSQTIIEKTSSPLVILS